MSSDVFWKSPPWRHLNAVPQLNCSTRLVHWQQNSCHHRLSVCAEQTAGTRWLTADVNGRSSTCNTQTDILEPCRLCRWQACKKLVGETCATNLQNKSGRRARRYWIHWITFSFNANRTFIPHITSIALKHVAPRLSSRLMMCLFQKSNCRIS